LKLLSILCLLLPIGGCLRLAQRPRVGTVTLLIDPNCQTKPAELQDCDMMTDPPKCKTALLTYKVDCARIKVNP
jgi:hypothetical protein